MRLTLLYYLLMVRRIVLLPIDIDGLMLCIHIALAGMSCASQDEIDRYGEMHVSAS